jgi:hypothetical protein
MAEEITKVDRFSVDVPNKAGEGARILGALAAERVSLVALWAYPLGGGKMTRVEIVPSDSAAFKAATRKAKVNVAKEATSFHLVGKDKAGVLASVLAKLAAIGVNVRAVQAVSAGSRFGSLIEVEAGDVRKAAKALGM